VKRAAFSVVMFSALIYLGLCALLFVTQSSFLYIPRAASVAHAKSAITLAMNGANVRVSHRPRQGRKALIYFGGNAEDVSASLKGFSRAFPNHALYLMHYRGYGGSTGSPSEAALFADALALHKKVAGQHSDITVIGRSLGSGIATYLASQRRVSRLMLITPYDSIANVAAQRLPMFPVHWLLLDKYESWRYAPLITAPTRILAAEHDEVIPRMHTNALLAQFQPGIARMDVLADTGHNTISADPSYLALLRAN
jgi:uncharacterized protein